MAQAHSSSPSRRRRRFFRPTGVGSFTAHSSRPFDDRFFADLDERLAQEERRSAAHAGWPLTIGGLQPGGAR